MKAYKNWYLMTSGMTALISCFLLFSCNNDDFPDNGNKGNTGESCDYICFGMSPDENARTRGNAGNNGSGYTSDRFVLRAGDSADTLCVRAIVSDGIDGSAFEGETPVTRGISVTKENFYESFHVLAYWKKGSTLVGEQFYMDADVTDKGSNLWSSANTYYWPGAGHTFLFYAWAPTNATNLSTPSSPTSTTLGYTVPADVTDQQDILVATTAEIVGNYNSTLPLSFRHICTAVKFTTGSQMQPGTIKSVALKGVLNSGTYDMANDSWALDAATGDFSQSLDKSMSGSETSGSEITTEEGTFMMLPQTLPANAMIEVVFNDGTTGTERTFTASVAGTEWPQGKTVTYRLSISPEYEFKLEDEKTLDAHFEIFKTKLIVEGLSDDQSWTVTAPSFGTTTLDAVTIQAQNDMNDYSARQGFWTDRWLQTSGSNLVDNGSARGGQTYSGMGNGTFPIAIFVPENVGDATRNIELTIQLNGNNVQTINIPQFSPSWFSDGLGCERIEGDSAPWGFYWSEDYSLTYDLTDSDQDSREGIYDYVSFYKTLNNTVIIKWILTNIFGVSIPDLSFVEMTQTNIGGNNFFNPPNYIANTVTINLGQLQPNDIALSETDGQSNTRDVYNYEGIQYASTLISRLEALGVQPTTTGEGINPTYNASIACMRYLNSWNILPEGNGYILTLSAEDYNPSWYLPARGEVSGITDDEHPLSGEYWSSTSVESSNKAYKYSSDGATITEELRNAVLNVRAVRKKP